MNKALLYRRPVARALGGAALLCSLWQDAALAQAPNAPPPARLEGVPAVAARPAPEPTADKTAVPAAGVQAAPDKGAPAARSASGAAPVAAPRVDTPAPRAGAPEAPVADAARPTDSSRSFDPARDGASAQGITFNFQDADIRSLVELMARLYGLIPIIGDDVKGKMSISVAKPLNPQEVFLVLSALLDAHGYTPIRTDKLLKVVPKREALQKPIDVFHGTDPAQLPEGDQVINLLIPIRNSKAATVLENLRQLVASTGNMFVNDNTNTLVVTDSASNMRRLLKLVSYLDNRLDENSKSTTRVYPLRYMKAKEMAESLDKVFGGKDGKSTLKITPIETSNTLVIVADLNVFGALENALQRLDERRRQVLIEAQIIEVQLSDQLDFGIRVEDFLLGSGAKKVSMGQAISSPMLSLTLAGASRAKTALLEMLAKDNKVNILSAPHILTSDNQKAKIVVGEERPILKSSTALNTGSQTTVSDYVYKDVGLELSVTPRITEDRDVAMEIQQRVTDILENVTFGSGSSAVSAPVMGKREATTNVIVRDGHTLVIGGLMKNEVRDERQKVPLLGDLPGLGWLFSNVHKVNLRTELLVFITPTVVENDAEGDRVGDNVRRAVGVVPPAPIGQSKPAGVQP